MNNQVVPKLSAVYFPSIPREEIASQCKYQYSIASLAKLGGGFSAAAAEFAKAIQNQPGGEGLYRCIFPEGVTGALVSFRDGSGKLGMIQNNGRTIAQARWVPADTVPIGIDPITIALAVAMMRIDKKMDEIQDTQEEILHFLQNDKESKIEGEINSLASVLDRYQFNSDNERWCGGQLTVVSNINVNAESSIRFYRKQIIDLLDKQKKIHSERDSRKLIAGVQRAIQYYKLSVYLHAYSAFLEVVLGNNFTKDYIDHILTTLDENAMQFREDYSKCHIVLENYAGSTVQTKVLSSMGSTSKAIGKVISKIPVISKGPIDEVLIAAGEQVIQSSSDKPEKAMKRFQESKDPGIQVFVDALQSMNQICNDPVELFFDEEMLYVCA